MKRKTTLLLVLLVNFGHVFAQDTIIWSDGYGNGTWIFERVYPIDTVEFGYPLYQFNPMPASLYVWDHPSYNNHPATPTSMLSYGLLQKYPTFDDGTRIYGIATTVLRNAQEYHTGPNPRFVVARRDIDGDFIVIDSMSLDSYRVDKIYDYYGVDPNNGVWSHNYTYCYEYYFDHPVYMPNADNFFVGSLMDSIDDIGCCPAVQTRLDCGLLPIGTMDTDRFWATHGNPAFADVWRDYAITAGSHSLGMWGVFFPIIRPDSLMCGAVERFRMEEWETDHVKLAWGTTRPFRDLHSGRFQIALGGLGPRPDTTNLLMFNDTTAVLQGLDSGVWYSTWVRAECCHCGCPMHGDTLIWGPWRGPVQFYLGSSQPGSSGIGAVEGAVSFSLSPNPASRMVTVKTDQPSTLTLTDATGREIQRINLSTYQPINVDVSTLPAGVYFVRLSTSPTIRKLIIR